MDTDYYIISHDSQGLAKACAGAKRCNTQGSKGTTCLPWVLGRASGGVSSGCQLSTTARGGPTQGREHCKLGNVVFSKPMAPLSSTTQTYSVEITGLLVGVPPSS